jgi:hypothetical protein
MLPDKPCAPCQSASGGRPGGGARIDPLPAGMESRARKSRALNSSLLGTRYTVGTLDNVGAVAYLGGGAHV